MPDSSEIIRASRSADPLLGFGLEPQIPQITRIMDGLELERPRPKSVESAQSAVFPRLPIDIVTNFERITDAVDSWNGIHDDIDDVESVADTRIIEHPKPFFSTTNNAVLFG